MYYLRYSVKFLKINVLLFNKSVWFAYLNGNFIQNPHTKQHVTTAEGGSCYRNNAVTAVLRKDQSPEIDRTI